MLVAWEVDKHLLEIWVDASLGIWPFVVVVVVIFTMCTASQRLVYTLFQSDPDRWRGCGGVRTKPFGSKGMSKKEFSPVIDIGRSQ